MQWNLKAGGQMLHRTAKQQLIIAQVFSLMALQKEQSRRLHSGVVLLMFEAGCRTHIARSFSVGPAGRVDLWLTPLPHAAVRQWPAAV